MAATNNLWNDDVLDDELESDDDNLEKTQFEAVEAIAKVAEIAETNNLLRQNFKTTRDLCYEKINLIQSLFEEGAIEGDSAEISSFKELLREMKIDLDSRSRNLERFEHAYN
ncbi:hypothetical protein FCV25MIE_28730 [Fagus crenata]